MAPRKPNRVTHKGFADLPRGLVTICRSREALVKLITYRSAQQGAPRPSMHALPTKVPTIPFASKAYSSRRKNVFRLLRQFAAQQVLLSFLSRGTSTRTHRQPRNPTGRDDRAGRGRCGAVPGTGYRAVVCSVPALPSGVKARVQEARPT